MKPDFSLVLPIQNQAGNIEDTIKVIIEVLSAGKINYELVLVENGSTDTTLARLRKIAAKNKRCRITVSSPGYGRAVIHGLNLARGRYLTYMPSDGQCDATVLPKVIAAATQPGVDLVKVWRTSRESIMRKFISFWFNRLTNFLFSLNTIDINASPTCFSRKKLKLLNLKSPDSFLDTELLIKARRFGWDIIRLPMRNFKRSGGKSTVKPKILIEFLTNLYNWKFHETKRLHQ